jgi:hypothetical protein
MADDDEDREEEEEEEGHLVQPNVTPEAAPLSAKVITRNAAFAKWEDDVPEVRAQAAILRPIFRTQRTHDLDLGVVFATSWEKLYSPKGVDALEALGAHCKAPGTFPQWCLYLSGLHETSARNRLAIGRVRPSCLSSFLASSQRRRESIGSFFF